MAEDLDEVLQELDAGGESPVYLLTGEEFLVRKAAERLLAKLVPRGSADLNLVTLDAATPKEVAAELDTLPMFGGRKVVLLRDPEFLAPRKGRPDALGKARDAWKANKKKEAARRVLAIASRAGWGVGDLDPSASGAPRADDWERELGIELAEADIGFLREVAQFCVAEGLSAPSGDETALVDWLAAKPGRGQVLVVVTTDFEKKSAFAKKAADLGHHLEFKGRFEGRGKPTFKNLDLTEFVTETLSPYKKKLVPGALEKLKERVGGNFRLLASELVKLALYTDHPTITQKDVELLVVHAREDDYFELSEALQKRDLGAALKYVADAIQQMQAPLMLHGAITSIVRGLLMNHERMLQLSEGRPPKSMGDFEARLWPKIEAEVKAAKGKLPHPYAAFMSMQAAGNFGRQELLRGLVACAEADLALKSGGDELVLERLLWTLCQKMPPPVNAGLK